MLLCVIMTLLRNYFGVTMASLWCYYEYNVALLWRYHGVIMALLWDYYGRIGATMRYYVVILSDPNLISVISWPYSMLFCLYPGAILALSWRYHILRYPALHFAQHDMD